MPIVLVPFTGHTLGITSEIWIAFPPNLPAVLRASRIHLLSERDDFFIGPPLRNANLHVEHAAAEYSPTHSLLLWSMTSCTI